MLTFIKECEKMKVRVISICDRYDSNKPQTKLHLHILGAIAENYIQENSGRISASIQNKKSRGKKYTKEIPFGYKLGKDNKLLECKEDRKVLMRIRNLKTRGHSYRSIADKLNGEGITTKKGKEWSKSLIGHYINNNVIGQVGVEAA
jgi:DNA invertase Pin-like site-specific DNA recombinase